MNASCDLPNILLPAVSLEFRLGYLVTSVSDLSGYVHSNGVYAAKLHALPLILINALSL